MFVSRHLGFGITAAALLSLAAAHPVSAQTITNFSFESAPVDTYSGIAGWTATGGGTIGGGHGGVGLDSSSNSTYANNGIGPDGSHVAWLQTNGSAPTTLQQTILGLNMGDQYVISFYDNKCFCVGGKNIHNAT